MFEGGIGHGYDQFVRRLAIRLNNKGAIFALGRVEQWAETIERNLLIAKINRGNFAAGDADDLLILLRAEQKGRSRRRNGDSGLQNKVRAEQEKENHEKENVDQRKDDEPAEVVLLCPAEFHPGRCRSNDRDELLEKSATFRKIAGN